MKAENTTKFVKNAYQLSKLNAHIHVMQKVNTALPKHKERQLDAILKPLYAERTKLRYNMRQMARK